jgi:hypothetical protein
MTNILAERLTNIYGDIDHPNPEGFFKELTDACQAWSTTDLDKAADILRRTHKGRRWPTMGDIMKACEQACEDRASRIPQQTGTHYPDCSKPHGMLHGPVAEQAKRDGWIGGLNEFLHYNGRLPNAAEQADIIKTSRLIDEVASGHAPDVPWAGELEKLAWSMIDRREKIAGFVQ